MSAISQNVEIEIDVRPVEDIIAEEDAPWRNERVLRELYWGRELSQREIANKLGCRQPTVSEWLERHNIKTRDGGPPCVGRASFRTNEQTGIEEWQVTDPDGNTIVGVHRLLAIADGADPHDVFGGHDVHHKTDIPWLNVPGAVEVVSRGEHRRTHTEAEWTEEDGLPVLVTQE